MTVRLHALGGGAAPEGLGADLLRMQELPERAKRELWAALEPSLDQPVRPEAERALDGFCARHALDEELLAAIVRSSRFLVREAAFRALDPQGLAQDIAALGGDIEISTILLAGYDRARRILREEVLRTTLAPHGDTVEDVSWRLDRVLATSARPDADVLVARLTLAVRRGEELRQVPLQLDLDGVRALRLACEAIEARAARGH
jgi:hypothetical protein